MPEKLSEAWEYWEPNPEVAELFAMTGAISGFAVLGIELEDGYVENSGFRFGCGNPNSCFFRLAPERPTGEREPIKPKSCEGCERSFVPRRPDRVYCSSECYHANSLHRLSPISCDFCGYVFHPRDRDSRFCSLGCVNDWQRAESAARTVTMPPRDPCTIGRPRTLPDMLLCALDGCPKLFRPNESGQRFCSLRCYRASPRFHRKKINDERFVKLYLAGYTLAEIAAEFRVTTRACEITKRRLGL